MPRPSLRRFSEPEPVPAVPPAPPPALLPPPVDCVLATAVLSTTRMLATFYWARSIGHNRPLLMLDFTCQPLTADSWVEIRDALERHHTERRARVARPLGLWVEGESLATQALYSGIDARPIPPHLLQQESWHAICQSAASHLVMNSIAFTRRAASAMEARPFLNAAGIYAGPRTEDPVVPAFLYGIVLCLDEVLARDPHPQKPARSRGS